MLSSALPPEAVAGLRRGFEKVGVEPIEIEFVVEV